MTGIYVVGDDTVIANLLANAAAVNQAVTQEMEAQAIKLQSYIRLVKLNGGNPLHQRSGNLSRSVQYSISTDGAQTMAVVTAGNSTSCKYAAIHEFGFSGSESVRSFTRNQTMAFGKSITPRQVTVRAFTRKMNMPERSFMRSSLQENASSIRQALQDAVMAVVHV